MTSGQAATLATVGRDDLMKKLRALLEDDDTEAAELLVELAGLPGAKAYRGDLAMLESALAEYDFDIALEILDKLEKVL